MDISLVLSLQDLSCTKIVSLLLNKVLPSIYSFYLESLKQKCVKLKQFSDTEYEIIKSHVTKDIAKLVSSPLLRKKLERFIAPLFHEIEEWLETCFRIWQINDNTFFYIIETIPECWSTDGTIDRQMSVELVIANEDLLLTNRFIFACTFGLYEHILCLWELLSMIEISFLRDLPSDVASVVKQWMDWLDSFLNKQWPYCVAWILGTRLWYKNMCVLKRVLSALTPIERSYYLKKYLNGGEVSDDCMRFCLTVMTSDERKWFFSESPVQVFRCISSWPLRNVFFDTVNSLWPYLTNDMFITVLETMSDQIINCGRNYENAKWKRDCVSLMEILQNVWTNRPPCFRNFSKNHYDFSYKLRFVLNCDFKKICFTEKLCRHIITEYTRKSVELSTTANSEAVSESRQLTFVGRLMKFFRYLLGLTQYPVINEEPAKQTITACFYCSLEKGRLPYRGREPSSELLF